MAELFNGFITIKGESIEFDVTVQTSTYHSRQELHKMRRMELSTLLLTVALMLLLVASAKTTSPKPSQKEFTFRSSYQSQDKDLSAYRIIRFAKNKTLDKLIDRGFENLDSKYHIDKLSGNFSKHQITVYYKAENINVVDLKTLKRNKETLFAKLNGGTYRVLLFLTFGKLFVNIETLKLNLQKLIEVPVSVKADVVRNSFFVDLEVVKTNNQCHFQIESFKLYHLEYKIIFTFMKDLPEWAIEIIQFEFMKMKKYLTEVVEHFVRTPVGPKILKDYNATICKLF